MTIQDLLRLMEKEIRLRNYSISTLKAYTLGIRTYLQFKRSNFYTVNVENIRTFLLAERKRGLAANSVNLELNAIKFFYRNVLHCQVPIKIKFAKRPRKVPIILTKSQILAIISQTWDIRNKTIFALAYGSGLRVSEVVNIRVRDVDFANNHLYISNAKGKKDRITILPGKLRKILLSFIVGKNSSDFVFHNIRGGKLHKRSVQQVFSRAKKKAGIINGATFHSLRHSFATHLLENGVDIRYIQSLLGHKSLLTTQIYTKVTKSAIASIESPL